MYLSQCKTTALQNPLLPAELKSSNLGSDQAVSQETLISKDDVHDMYHSCRRCMDGKDPWPTPNLDGLTYPVLQTQTSRLFEMQLAM